MWSMDSIHGINSLPIHTCCHATFGNLPVQTQVSQSMNFFDRMLANVTQAET